MIPTHNPSEWGVATVTNVTRETPTVKTFDLALPFTAEHLAGQHYEIRLTAEDGYQAARLYSAASAADGTNNLQLTVALLENGEVSPYLHHQVRAGDQLEIRGPLGKFFIWEPDMTDPLILVAGGSGIVPLRCILQARTLAQSKAPVTILYSAPTYEEIIYKDEMLDAASPTIVTLTREYPSTWQGQTGRITAALLRDTAGRLASGPSEPRWYVCGSTPFVETIANTIVAIGTPTARIKAERYGGEDLPLTTDV